MHRYKIALLFCLLISVLALLPLGRAVEASPVKGCKGWSVVTSPNPPDSSNGLNGMAAISANNVWAVGFYYPTYHTGRI
jgi:hypothetical protein